MSLYAQVLLFAIPGMLTYLGVVHGAPWLVRRGWPVVYAFWLFLWTPALLLLPLSLALFTLAEDGGLSLASISERFRLTPLTGSDWLWIAGGVLLTLFTEQALQPVSQRLARCKLLTPPSYLPAPFHPLKSFALPPREFFGVPLHGNWKLLLLFVPLHSLAMFREEITWRGFLLPIQEAQFAGLAWVVNGFMWAWLMHMVLKWHFIAMVPGMLAAPFVAQQTGSTLAALAVHVISNSPLWILLLIGILARPPSHKTGQTDWNREG